MSAADLLSMRSTLGQIGDPDVNQFVAVWTFPIAIAAYALWKAYRWLYPWEKPKDKP